MIDWKDVPHLFANGKFRLLHKNDTRIKYLIVSYAPQRNQFVVRVEGHGSETKICDSPKAFTLLARKMTDMTDEESATDPTPVHGFYGDTTDSFLYLLSIGVYPFDDNDFGDTVIDINTL